jgi:hypothetical protein
MYLPERGTAYAKKGVPFPQDMVVRMDHLPAIPLTGRYKILVLLQ